MDYKQSGVNIEEGYRSVENIKALAAQTMKQGVLSRIGSFGAFMRIPKGYKNPVLVSGTDGVGTKLKIAFAMERYNTVGIDAVAMCVNDILCHGAQPLFFLDYLACGKLDAKVAADLVAGVAQGCLLGDLALIGGETAEMPGFYAPGEYDIAGFCVGVVEEEELIDGRAIQEGDVLIGLRSSGFHSNGYSLVRRLFPDVHELLDGKEIGDALLEPTRIYVKSVRGLMECVPVHGMAHITGGGFVENIPRMFAQENLTAEVHKDRWTMPFLFEEALRRGADPKSIYNTFNMGIGFVLALAAKDQELALERLRSLGEDPVVLGCVRPRSAGEDALCLL
ncbi:Phosphoribosylformylglycinamidine cyclo-ligase [Clostridiaceae bacterium JG1575]|nr:Phosphoribosylformylglycinamidine cyclo-ligase [Clostridiaceae bacterium JG1575]